MHRQSEEVRSKNWQAKMQRYSSPKQQKEHKPKPPSPRIQRFLQRDRVSSPTNKIKTWKISLLPPLQIKIITALLKRARKQQLKIRTTKNMMHQNLQLPHQELLRKEYWCIQMNRRIIQTPSWRRYRSLQVKARLVLLLYPLSSCNRVNHKQVQVRYLRID